MNPRLTKKIFQKFEALIKDGAPMEAKNTHGLTALQVVCNNQDVNMVTTLLRVGCQVNAKSSVTGIYSKVFIKIYYDMLNI